VRTGFKESGTGAPVQRHAGDREADGEICRITKKVERIGLQRAGTGGKTGADFGHEHRGVQDKRDPQRAPPSRAV
jgi:hypothetical protein